MLATLLTAVCTAAACATAPDTAATRQQTLREVTVKERAPRNARTVALHTQRIGAAELKRAACCNLGESFGTNPSVDVTYSDAATGARQIKLLGLSGQYVQMLTENIPDMRLAAAPYGLAHVPGPWMQSIQVSKGAASVKNGYESTTGQINVEFKKPQADGNNLAVNGYADHMGKAEANADINLHLGQDWSTATLVHAENAFAHNHAANHDGFADMPAVRQIAAMHRWAYMGRNHVFQAAARFLAEDRTGGTLHHGTAHAAPYDIDIDTRRGAFWTKNAYIFDHDNDGNIALILSGVMHNTGARYGYRTYTERQREAYAQLMFERKWTGGHALSAGASLTHDRLAPRVHTGAFAPGPPVRTDDTETVGGAYAQYTYNRDGRLIAMCGVRYDQNSRYGALVTPRMHVRLNAGKVWSFNASCGIGRRSPHIWADNAWILASARNITVRGTLRQEKALNTGASANATFKIGGRRATFGADYYYTRLWHRTNVDLDRPMTAVIDLDTHGYSHALQTEFETDLPGDINLLAAYRYTRVRVACDGRMVQKPLTPSSKALLTVGWQPRMGLWQIDATLTCTGGGSMPAPYITAGGTPSWQPRYNAFFTLNAQVTRNWRRWAVYIGGENLTGYRQKTPVISAANPYAPTFDATMVHGPLTGAMIYAGFRFNTKFGKDI